MFLYKPMRLRSCFVRQRCLTVTKAQSSSCSSYEFLNVFEDRGIEQKALGSSLQDRGDEASVERLCVLVSEGNEEEVLAMLSKNPNLAMEHDEEGITSQYHKSTLLVRRCMAGKNPNSRK